MENSDRPHKEQGASAPGQAKTMEDRNTKPAPVTTDDRPRREDELVGDFLQDPSPEDDGKLSGQDQKGVVPGKKQPD